jgi:hypothetical protein
MLPTQYFARSVADPGEGEKRLMAAVLQAVVDDCRDAVHRRVTGLGPPALRSARGAIAYVASGNRTWPYSFENLCEALGLNAGHLRRKLREESDAPARAAAIPADATA